MPVPTVAISTLTALAAPELDEGVRPTPSITSGDVPAAESSQERETVASRLAISPPETLEGQTFTPARRETRGERLTGQLLTSTYTREEPSLNFVNATAVPLNGRIAHLAPIQSSLPPGLAMRLPSQFSSGEEYAIAISPTAKTGLRVSLFTCPERRPSCLIGSVTVTSQKVKAELPVAAPVALAQGIRGDWWEEEGMQSLAWEQDSQFYTIELPDRSPFQIIALANSAIAATPIPSSRTPPEPRPEAALLQNRHPILTTAEHLRRGEIVTNLRYRQAFPEGTAREVGLTGQPSFSVGWGVTDSLELTLDAQTVDNGGPGEQGDFTVQRINPDGTGPNFFQEFTLQAKQRLWQNAAGTLALSGVAATSVGNGGRPFHFSDGTSGQNDTLVPSLELPLTINSSDRWQFTLSPKIAFLPDDNALYFNTPPLENPGTFGTTFGVAGGVIYRLNPRLILWGDAFVPLAGNNTIDRESGLPAQTVAFNAGLRYLVNPRLATDLFVSNTLGNTGALSIVADRALPALGLGVTYLPGITRANRRYPPSFRATQQPPPDTPGGLGFLDGGTIPQQQLRLNVQGGEQGILTGIRYGLLDDLEIGVFLESIPGTTDESALGFSGRIRFLHQADGDPFTLSGAVTFARSNNVLINLINDNPDEFAERDLEKGGFAFSNERDGELFIISFSVPMHYQFTGGSAIWLTPTLGFVQRNGLEVAGLNAGGSVLLEQDLEILAEVGVELSGKGNVLIGDSRETAIPWAVGLRWHPASLLGISGLQLEAYATNRLGTTPFGSLRVRAENDLAVGVGLVLPIQF